MDTSKKFILMSEKAVEIQRKLRNTYPSDGDVLCYIGNNEEISHKIHIFPLAESWTDWELVDFVRLLRQGQLQDMVLNKSGNTPYANMVNLHASFDYMVRYKMLDQCPAKMYANMFESMEQLWVAYVMQKLYSKLWNGTDWEKERE